MQRRLVVWYASLGAFDQAYAIMNHSLDDFARSGMIGTAWGFLWFAELAPFRDDVRFSNLAARMNLPKYWQRYGPPRRREGWVSRTSRRCPASRYSSAAACRSGSPDRPRRRAARNARARGRNRWS